MGHSIGGQELLAIREGIERTQSKKMSHTYSALAQTQTQKSMALR